MFTLHKNDNYNVNASAVYEMTPTEKGNNIFVHSEKSRSIKNNGQSSYIFRSRFNFGSKFQSNEAIHTAVSEELFEQKMSSNLLITPILILESMTPNDKWTLSFEWTALETHPNILGEDVLAANLITNSFKSYGYQIGTTEPKSQKRRLFKGYV